MTEQPEKGQWDFDAISLPSPYRVRLLEQREEDDDA